MKSYTTLVDFGMASVEGNPKRAQAYFELALAADPDDTRAHYGLGRAENLLGHPTAAVKHFGRALGSRGLRGYARLGLGDALLQMGRRAEAITEYRQVPFSLRDTPEVALRIAVCSLSLGELPSAIRILRRQFVRNSQNNYVTALLARCYAMAGKFKKSFELAETVLNRTPNFSEALKAACMALVGLGDVEATIRYSRRLMLEDATPVNVSHYLYHILFSSLSATAIDAEYLQLRHIYSAESAVEPQTLCGDRSTGRTRIAYVSALFGVHSACFQPIFRNHDKSRYEIHVYADHAKDVFGKQTLQHFCEQWHETAGLANLDLARLIKTNGIDVLVDCDGHFHSGYRLGLYRHRPSPVQVSFLYPHRTWVEAIDYQITDARLSPKNDNRTSERLVRLPLFACHQVPPLDIPVGDLPALRNGFVTFGSFSPPLKINESVVETWAHILHCVPRSRLILHNKMGPLGGGVYPDIRERFLRLFGSYGIDSTRLSFIGDRDLASHMALHRDIDIGLDPFPHNGMRTTFMSLWMGVPVVTKAGDSMVSRMGVGLLTEAGVPDWVTSDVKAYVEEACKKASDLAGLSETRRSLRRQVELSLLMDGEKFTRYLEAAFEQMLDHRHSQRGVKHAYLA